MLRHFLNFQTGMHAVINKPQRESIHDATASTRFSNICLMTQIAESQRGVQCNFATLYCPQYTILT